ncbi:hypothetical protein [Actinomadura sp. WMMB 499]|uniref:phosphatase domain-containing protein n=1 Tax=Actinomadura sp. WMMB 499 TaxID=1219491 RepID=UPI001245E8B9|nr:hypothetical protein [Actinomadura sp. WMMB 499]QFG25433.1 hypothetical protein F7P10_34015 [Actinomadura sp. WMMB 499]
MGLFLVDLDGTLALRDDNDPKVRKWHDWDRVGEDLPNLPVIEVVQALDAAAHMIVYLTGRPSVCRRQTNMWIDTHMGHIGELLLMREEGDYRPDHVVKRELYEQKILPVYGKPTAVLDDRNSVVKMWREELGLTVLQVAEGDF